MSKSRTVELTRLCWRILSQERQLLLIPLLSFVTLGAVIATGAGFYAWDGAFHRVHIDRHQLNLVGVVTGAVKGVSVVDLLALGALYLLATVAIVVINAVLFGAAYERIQGRPASLRVGFAMVIRNASAVVEWALFSVTVGVLIEAMRSGRNPILKLVGLVLGITWNFTTFFVVPILVVQGLSPREAVRESSRLLRATFGDQLRRGIGFGLLAVPLLVLAMVVGFLYAKQGPGVVTIAAASVALPAIVGGMLLISAMEVVFTTATYSFAIAGDSGDDFPDDFVREAYLTKSTRSWFMDERFTPKPGAKTSLAGGSWADYPTAEPPSGKPAAWFLQDRYRYRQ